MGAVHEPGARRLVVAITGASGPQFGIRLLQVLADDRSVEAHLILSDAAQRTLELEVGTTGAAVRELADVVYDPGDYAASVSSGSFRTMGMVVAPCSMSTLGAIANGVSTSLVARTADVTLKERRPLVLLTRETPLNLIHLRNMVAVTAASVSISAASASCAKSPEIRLVASVLGSNSGSTIRCGTGLTR